MRRQVEAWQRIELTDVTAKVVIYEAFVEGKLEAPKHLARTVHDLYFEPKYEEFRPRTIWSPPMRSPPRSRNWILFRSSRQQPSWANSSKSGSHSRSRRGRSRPATCSDYFKKCRTRTSPFASDSHYDTCAGDFGSDKPAGFPQVSSYMNQFVRDRR